MSLDTVADIAEVTPKGKLLATLTAVHLAEEKKRDAKARPSPTAQRPTQARPAPVRPSAPANPLADVAEHLLRQRASHRSSTPDQAAPAIAELARRGIIYANGIFTQSNRSK
jgi:hypothetical protein